MNEEKVVETVESRLEKLGFKTASKVVETKRALKKKLMIAYEHYRYVRPEKITAFNQKLMETTRKGYTYSQLVFTPVGNYAEVPPDDVLVKLEEAMNRGCFDSFEVAHIQAITKVPDPILFGIVEGCQDKFYVAQWDNDCRIEDILKENEG